MPLICTLHILSLRRSTTLIIGPHRDHSIVSRSTADLTWRLWFKSVLRSQKIISLPQVVPKFPLLGVTLIGVYGLLVALEFSRRSCSLFSIQVIKKPNLLYWIYVRS